MALIGTHRLCSGVVASTYTHILSILRSRCTLDCIGYNILGAKEQLMQSSFNRVLMGCLLYGMEIVGYRNKHFTDSIEWTCRCCREGRVVG